MAKQRNMQIEMAMKQRQAQMAMQRAMAIERFHYYSCFVGLAAIFLPIGAVKSHKPQMVAPLVPMSIGWLF